MNEKRKWKFWWVLGLVLVNLGAFFLLFKVFAEEDMREDLAYLKVGIGETFPLEQILDTDGNIVTKKVFNGKKETLVDFWFLGCGPCYEEMQHFPKLLKNNADLQIKSINIDGFERWKNVITANPSDLQSLAEKEVKNHSKFPVKGLQLLNSDILNWQHLNRRSSKGDYFNGYGLGVTKYPSYFLVNQNGQIIDRFESVMEYSQHPVVRRIARSSPFLYFLFSSHDVKMKDFLIVILMVSAVYSILSLIISRLFIRSKIKTKLAVL